MKKIMVVAFVLVILIAWFTVSSQAADEGASYYQVGDKGYFQHPWIEGSDFVIWPGKTIKGASRFGGLITPETKIWVANRKVDRKNLDLLSGKPVVAFATFKLVGRGEGSKEDCLELTIFVLSEEAYHIPVVMEDQRAKK